MVGLNTGLQLNLDKFDGERILYLKAAFGKGESKEKLHYELLVVKSVETKLSALFLRSDIFALIESVNLYANILITLFVLINSLCLMFFSICFSVLKKCTESEPSKYYSDIGKPDLRISKQADMWIT